MKLEMKMEMKSKSNMKMKMELKMECGMRRQPGPLIKINSPPKVLHTV